MKTLIISGLSGAGKSKAASFLEDMGYYIVDNMPAAMILKFAEFCAGGSSRYDRVALVYDVRTATSFTELFDVLDQLKTMVSECRMLFLEASADTIIHRYKETRRRHPLADRTDTLEQAVLQEREVLAPVRSQADFVIDTTYLSTAQLRQELLRIFEEEGEKGGMRVTVTSFGFKHGLPLDSDLVLDVRFLPNPFYVEELRSQTGNDRPVADFICRYPQTFQYLKLEEQLLDFLLPQYISEGKAQLVISVGCTGGQHRSVFIANKLYEFLRERGYSVEITHRDIPK